MHERELRLALVCYGGISLAVYMHGITKEVWHLARASRAGHDGTATAGVEAVYAALLDEVSDRGEARLRVLPDIVAGASAGGINGIFLGQAIATGQSLDPLTDLWLTSADVEVLIDPDAAPTSRFSKVWALPLAWMAAGRSGGEVETPNGPGDAATRDEVRAKLSHFIRSRWFEPPFGGAVFTRLLVDAFAAMAASDTGPRLLPPGQPLDLFVTVTDFTGHPERLRLNSPAEVVETEHRLVIDFTDPGGDAGPNSLAPIPELVFAARATSSFPGAFPPFTVAELDAVLAERGSAWPERRDFLGRILPRQAAAGTAERAVLIDGSVLANAPFRPAIEALAQRPARRRVDRRFVYIDPSPGMKFRVGGGNAATPGFFQTILGAISELPRQQPIRDNLEAIAARSERIDRLRAIVEAVRPRVDAAVEQLFGRTLFLDRPTPARLVAWRKRAHQAAEADAGIAYAAYDRVKREGVVDMLADLAGQIAGRRGSERRQALRPAIAAALPGDAVETLRRFDTRFRIRRLRLLARRLAELEGEHPEVELAPLRTAIYTSLSTYLEASRAEHHVALRGVARAARVDAGPLIDALADSLDLHRLDAATDEALAVALADTPRAVRRPLLLAYLGFLYFDVATMPLLGGEGLDEFDPIRVDRIAPEDATSIRSGGAEATLKGIQFNSFGAFFSRAYRENDYLWGRLHGAERMIDIVVSTLSPNQRMRPGRVAALKRDAFRAILDEEEGRLTAVPGLVADIRREVG
jgi:patatin-related protein